MAEGGDVHSPINDSVKNVKIFCDPCSEDGVSLEANGYCVNCKEYLCEHCFRHHLVPRPSRNHVLKDAASMPQSGTDKSSPEPAIMCQLHKDTPATSYSKSREAFNCDVCVSVLAGSGFCNDFISLHEMIKDVKYSKKFKQFAAKLTDTHETYQNKKEIWLERKRKTNQHYEHLKECISLQLEEMKTSDMNRVLTIIENCDVAIESLHRMLEGTELFKDKHSTLFALMHLNSAELDRLASGIKSVAKEDNFSFCPIEQTSINSWLASFTSKDNQHVNGSDSETASTISSVPLIKSSTSTPSTPVSTPPTSATSTSISTGSSFPDNEQSARTATASVAVSSTTEAAISNTAQSTSETASVAVSSTTEAAISDSVQSTSTISTPLPVSSTTEAAVTDTAQSTSAITASVVVSSTLGPSLSDTTQSTSAVSISVAAPSTPVRSNYVFTQATPTTVRSPSHSQFFPAIAWCGSRGFTRPGNLIGRINAKHYGDRPGLIFFGMALVNTDCLILTEFNNQSVRTVSIGNRSILSSTRLNYNFTPFDVTVTDDQQVYVAAQGSYGKLLHLSSPATSTYNYRELHTYGSCYTLTYSGCKRLKILSGRALIETDLDGNKLRTIHDNVDDINSAYNTVLVSVMHSCHDNISGSVFVSCASMNSIVEITDLGHLKVVAQSPELNSPFGLVMDSDGTILVCSGGNKTVLRVTKSGKIMDNVLPRPLDFGPLSLALDVNSRRLYIAGGDDHILIFQI